MQGYQNQSATPYMYWLAILEFKSKLQIGVSQRRVLSTVCWAASQAALGLPSVGNTNKLILTGKLGANNQRNLKENCAPKS